MKTEIKSEDEFQFFKGVMMQLFAQNREGTLAFIGQMNKPKQQFLKDIMTVKRVKLQGQNQDVPRKIIRVKRSGKAGGGGGGESPQKSERMME